MATTSTSSGARCTATEMGGLLGARLLALCGRAVISAFTLLLAVSDSPIQAAESRMSATARALRRPVTATWSEQTLSAALDRVASAYEVPIWLDRRIDPNQQIEMQLRDVALQEALNRLASTSGAAVGNFRGVVYVGPAATTNLLEQRSVVMRQAISTQPQAVQKLWRRAAPWSSPRWSEPRTLLIELAQAAQTTLENPEAIPRDVWDARQLPSMKAIDQATLLLANFDLTWEAAGPRRLRLTAAPPAPATIASQPDASAESSPLSHSKPIVSRPRDPNAKRSPRAERQITLHVESQPLGAILDQLTLQLDVEFVTAAPLEAETLRQRLASCRVEQASLDETLKALLQPLGLAHRRTGARVTLLPADANQR